MEFYSGFETEPKKKRAKKVATETMEAPSQDKRMYSEEDLKDAYFSAIKATGEGWNGEYAEGNSPNVEEKFMEDFNIWFEQFKKK
jgi:hypothetical protein